MPHGNVRCKAEHRTQSYKVRCSVRTVLSEVACLDQGGGALQDSGDVGDAPGTCLGHQSQNLALLAQQEAHFGLEGIAGLVVACRQSQTLIDEHLQWDACKGSSKLMRRC